MATRKKNTRVPRARFQRLHATPVRGMSESIKRLEIVLAIITVAAAALELQNTDVDAEVATALRRCAADPLGVEIERLTAGVRS